MSARRSETTVEFGDFQTPLPLAELLCARLASEGEAPATILEPTCGIGNFLVAAARHFPQAQQLIGVEINPTHLAVAREQIRDTRVQLLQGDFFSVDWHRLLAPLPQPILVLGNPPWVTNSKLGLLGGDNLPRKRNVDAHKGIDAKTGKANFDISEWMLRQTLKWRESRRMTVAQLCKTSVARRYLTKAWRESAAGVQADLFGVDARRYFDATVEACALVVRWGVFPNGREATIFADLSAEVATGRFGERDGALVADLDSYERWAQFRGVGKSVSWRSGIKHDAAQVMELKESAGCLMNGYGSAVDVESDYLFPLVKSSDLTQEPLRIGDRWVIVPQRGLSDSTRVLQHEAPRLWRYLCSHGRVLDERASAIYRGRPRFAMFGIGPYSFAEWKVAISGLYKSLRFVIVPPTHGKPTLLDDTCYFLPCRGEREAKVLRDALNSEAARGLLGACVFWDAKRPITVEVLKRLDLRKLLQWIGGGETLESIILSEPGVTKTDYQSLLFALEKTTT